MTLTSFKSMHVSTLPLEEPYVQLDWVEAVAADAKTDVDKPRAEAATTEVARRRITDLPMIVMHQI